MTAERNESSQMQETQSLQVNAHHEEESPQSTKEEMKTAPNCLTPADTLKELCKTLEAEVKEVINRVNAGEDSVTIIHSLLATLHQHIPEIHFFLHPLSAQEQLELDSRPPLYNIYDKVVAIYPSVHKIKELHNLHGSLLILTMKLAAHYLLHNENTPAGQDLSVFGGLTDIIRNFDDNWKRLRKDPRAYNKPDLWVEILMARCDLEVAMARSCLATDEAPTAISEKTKVDTRMNEGQTEVAVTGHNFEFTDHNGETIILKPTRSDSTKNSNPGTPLFTAPSRHSIFPARNMQAVEQEDANDETHKYELDFSPFHPQSRNQPTFKSSRSSAAPSATIIAALQSLSTTESTARALHILFRSTTNMTNLYESWTNSFWAHLGMVRDCIYGMRFGDAGAAAELWNRVYGEEARVDVRSLDKYVSSMSWWGVVLEFEL